MSAASAAATGLPELHYSVTAEDLAHALLVPSDALRELVLRIIADEAERERRVRAARGSSVDVLLNDQPDATSSARVAPLAAAARSLLHGRALTAHSSGGVTGAQRAAGSAALASMIGGSNAPNAHAVCAALQQLLVRGRELWFERASAARGLRLLGVVSRAVVDTLSVLCADDDWSVRLAAVDALASFVRELQHVCGVAPRDEGDNDAADVAAAGDERAPSPMRQQAARPRDTVEALPLQFTGAGDATSAPASVAFAAMQMIAERLVWCLPDRASVVSDAVARHIAELRLRPAFVALALIDALNKPSSVATTPAPVRVRALLAVRELYAAAGEHERVTGGVLQCVLGLACSDPSGALRAAAASVYAALVRQMVLGMRDGVTLPVCEFDLAALARKLWDVEQHVRVAVCGALSSLLVTLAEVGARPRFTPAGGAFTVRRGAAAVAAARARPRAPGGAAAAALASPAPMSPASLGVRRANDMLSRHLYRGSSASGLASPGAGVGGSPSALDSPGSRGSLSPQPPARNDRRPGAMLLRRDSSLGSLRNALGARVGSRPELAPSHVSVLTPPPSGGAADIAELAAPSAGDVPVNGPVLPRTPTRPLMLAGAAAAGGSPLASPLSPLGLARHGSVAGGAGAGAGLADDAAAVTSGGDLPMVTAALVNAMPEQMGRDALLTASLPDAHTPLLWQVLSDCLCQRMLDAASPHMRCEAARAFHELWLALVTTASAAAGALPGGGASGRAAYVARVFEAESDALLPVLALLPALVDDKLPETRLAAVFALRDVHAVALAACTADASGRREAGLVLSAGVRAVHAACERLWQRLDGGDVAQRVESLRLGAALVVGVDPVVGLEDGAVLGTAAATSAPSASEVATPAGPAVESMRAAMRSMAGAGASAASGADTDAQVGAADSARLLGMLFEQRVRLVRASGDGLADKAPAVRQNALRVQHMLLRDTAAHVQSVLRAADEHQVLDERTAAVALVAGCVGVAGSGTGGGGAPAGTAEAFRSLVPLLMRNLRDRVALVRAAAVNPVALVVRHAHALIREEGEVEAGARFVCERVVEQVICGDGALMEAALAVVLRLGSASAVQQCNEQRAVLDAAASLAAGAPLGAMLELVRFDERAADHGGGGGGGGGGRRRTTTVESSSSASVSALASAPGADGARPDWTVFDAIARKLGDMRVRALDTLTAIGYRSHELHSACMSLVCESESAALREAAARHLSLPSEEATDSVLDQSAPASDARDALRPTMEPEVMQVLWSRIAHPSEVETVRAACARGIAAGGFVHEVLLELLLAQASRDETSVEQLMPLMVRQRATTPALVRFLSRMMMTEVPARRGVAAAALEQLFIGDLTGATRALFMFGDPLSRAFLFEPLVDYIARRMPFIPDEWHHFLAKLMTKKRDVLTALVVMLLREHQRRLASGSFKVPLGSFQQFELPQSLVSLAEADQQLVSVSALDAGETLRADAASADDSSTALGDSGLGMRALGVRHGVGAPLLVARRLGVAPPSRKVDTRAARLVAAGERLAAAVGSVSVVARVPVARGPGDEGDTGARAAGTRVSWRVTGGNGGAGAHRGMLSAPAAVPAPSSAGVAPAAGLLLMAPPVAELPASAAPVRWRGSVSARSGGMSLRELISGAKQVLGSGSGSDASTQPPTPPSETWAPALTLRSEHAQLLSSSGGGGASREFGNVSRGSAHGGWTSRTSALRPPSEPRPPTAETMGARVRDVDDDGEAALPALRMQASHTATRRAQTTAAAMSATERRMHAMPNAPVSVPRPLVELAAAEEAESYFWADSALSATGDGTLAGSGGLMRQGIVPGTLRLQRSAPLSSTLPAGAMRTLEVDTATAELRAPLAQLAQLASTLPSQRRERLSHYGRGGGVRAPLNATLASPGGGTSSL